MMVKLPSLGVGGAWHPAARTRSRNGRRMAHIRAARKARRARKGLR